MNQNFWIFVLRNEAIIVFRIFYLTSKILFLFLIVSYLRKRRNKVIFLVFFNIAKKLVNRIFFGVSIKGNRINIKKKTLFVYFFSLTKNNNLSLLIWVKENKRVKINSKILQNAPC